MSYQSPSPPHRRLAIEPESKNNDGTHSLCATTSPLRRRRNPPERSRSPSGENIAKGDSKVSLLGIPEGRVNISGGEFTAVGGHQILLEVNLSGLMQGPKNHPVDSKEIDSGNVVEEKIQNTAEVLSRPTTPVAVQKAVLRPVEDSQSMNTVYFHYLASKKRGSPLWIPEPNRQLTVEYQRNGLVIGDVGIITERGLFDTLFNIQLPPEHPLSINPDCLPRKFSPLRLKPNHITRYSDFKRGSTLASESIKVSFANDDSPSGLIFESSAPDGAILTLPHGASSEDLGNTKKLYDYLSVHGEEMYKCAIVEHGRVIRNGDLRVITGFDKASSWCMAAFSNPPSQKNTFRMKFRTRNGGSPEPTYSWESSGTAEVKAGPDQRETEALRMADPSQRDVEYENQAVFVRTENITLNTSTWDALIFKCDSGEADLDDGSESDSDSDGPSPRSGDHVIGSSGPRIPPEKSGALESSTRGSRSYSSMPTNTTRAHPSNGINNMLLTLHPSAKMAITGDDIWISVLQEDDRVLPSVETLWTRITEIYSVCLESGVVTWKRRQDQTPALLHSQPEIRFSALETPPELHYLEAETYRYSLPTQTGQDKHVELYTMPSAAATGSVHQYNPVSRPLESYDLHHWTKNHKFVGNYDSVVNSTLPGASSFDVPYPMTNSTGFDTTECDGDAALNSSDSKRTQDGGQTTRGRKLRKPLKGKDNVLWPPELDAALIEGLANLRDEKPVKRNQLLSDWIFEKTGKRRSPRQIGLRSRQIRGGGIRRQDEGSSSMKQSRTKRSDSPMCVSNTVVNSPRSQSPMYTPSGRASPSAMSM